MTDTPHIEDEQRCIAELLRSFDVPAPESLHRRIESLVASHQSRRFAPRSPRRVLRQFSPLGLAGRDAPVVKRLEDRVGAAQELLTASLIGSTSPI